MTGVASALRRSPGTTNLKLLAVLLSGIAAALLCYSLGFQRPKSAAKLADATSTWHAHDEDLRDALTAGAGTPSEVARWLDANPVAPNPDAPASDAPATTGEREAPPRYGPSAVSNGRADLAALNAAHRGSRVWILQPVLLALAVVLPFLLTMGCLVTITRVQVNSRGGLMMMTSGFLFVGARFAAESALPGTSFWGLGDLVLVLFAGASTLPWNNGLESVRPLVPPYGLLLIALAIPAAVKPGLSGLDRAVIMMMSPLLFVPAAMLAQWRSRIRAGEDQRLRLGRRVQSMGEELSRARIVHEAMFPDPSDGAVVFEYEYQPIHEIGGDYVHLHRDPQTERVILTLLDVAGHGLAAALTVNRLFGELERVLAEHAPATPDIIMTLLNRYIHLTMSRHSMFATGICISLDPATGDLQWVNAGHPPAMVCRKGHPPSDLEPTSIVLGAIGPDDYAAVQKSLRLDVGDVIIAYTDGVFEARNPEGQQFGIPAVRDLCRFDPPPRSWPRFIANAVSTHHAGGADDDVLISCLRFARRRVASGVHADAATARVGGDSLTATSV